MDTFVLSTHPLPSCMWSAAPWWMAHTREERRNSGFFHMCFAYQAGKLQKEEDQISADTTSTGLPHPRRKKGSEPLIVTASQFSTPSTNTVQGNQRVHCQSPVICHWCSGHSSQHKCFAYFLFSLCFSLRAKNMFQDCSQGRWALSTY